MATKAKGTNREHEARIRAPRKTIFIRNLPFTTTNKELEELFSDEAPVKQAFVVKDKGIFMFQLFYFFSNVFLRKMKMGYFSTTTSTYLKNKENYKNYPKSI